jgi:hypothetical protein
MDRLEAAIRTLWNIDYTGTPMAVGDAREAALIEGLNAMAEAFGKEIVHTRIDGMGEMSFTLRGADQGMGQFGKRLSETLSTVSCRQGGIATGLPVPPYANFVRINHFEVEKLLKLYGEKHYDLTGPDEIEPANNEASIASFPKP